MTFQEEHHDSGRRALLRRGVAAIGAMSQLMASGGVGSFSFSKAAQAASLVSVRDFGARGDGRADDTLSLQKAFDHVARFSGTLVFPGGRYRISRYLNLRGASGSVVSAGGIKLAGGPDVVIEQVNQSEGYFRDGFRIGDASPRDGGTGHRINIADVTVDGFEFINCRIGVWAVYGRQILIQNIGGNRTAVVAVGNDFDDECRDVVIRNITRTAGFDGKFYTVGLFSTTDFLVEDVTSLYPVSGAAVTIANSRNGTIRRLVIDQKTRINAGIELTVGTQDVRVSQFDIKNCGPGIVTFDTQSETRNKRAVFEDGIIRNCAIAIDPQASDTEFRDIVTSGNRVSLRLLADGTSNRFRRVRFLEKILQDPAKVKHLQKFIQSEL